MIKALSKTEGPLKWLVMACLLAVALGVGFIALNQLGATQDKYTAQANAETLAKDIGTVCNTQSIMVNNRDICEKGESVLENPNSAIAGPKGDPGLPGLDGDDGPPGPKGDPGLPGKDGVPGTNGIDGKEGLPGQNGIDGLNGKDGLNGTNGTNGTNGADGAPGPQGPPPSSFTWTDAKTGATYTCKPDPVGSTTYTCVAHSPVP